MIRRKSEEGVRIPMVLTCGTEDFLLRENRAFDQYLKIEHIDEEFPGTHNWTFWEESMERTAAWLLED